MAFYANINGRKGSLCFLVEVAARLDHCFSFRAAASVGFGMLATRERNIMDSNLVDSASSHTLVSKIKPCMSKYKSLTLKLRTAHYISYNLFDSPLLLG